MIFETLRLMNAETIMQVMLGFFAFCSFLLALVTLWNKFRLRNIRLTWRQGKLAGFPLFATIFTGFTVLLLIVAWYNGMGGHKLIIGMYGFMSINWMVSSYLMSKRYITDHGIAKNINDPSQTIAWSDIHDFYEHKGMGFYRFSFFYSSRNKTTGQVSCHKLDIEVPEQRIGAFRKILAQKLGRRFHMEPPKTWAEISHYGKPST